MEIIFLVSHQTCKYARNGISETWRYCRLQWYFSLLLGEMSLKFITRTIKQAKKEKPVQCSKYILSPEYREKLWHGGNFETWRMEWRRHSVLCEVDLRGDDMPWRREVVGQCLNNITVEESKSVFCYENFNSPSDLEKMLLKIMKNSVNR